MIHVQAFNNISSGFNFITVHIHLEIIKIMTTVCTLISFASLRFRKRLLLAMRVLFNCNGRKYIYVIGYSIVYHV